MLLFYLRSRTSVNGKIHGKYDEETRGIEFTFAADEIDHLLKTYKEWESRKYAKN